MSTQVLVVDDDRSSVDIITEVLKREGHQLFVADGGRAAIQILERKRIDLVITDLQMPDMDGISLLKNRTWKKKQNKKIRAKESKKKEEVK